MKLPGENGVQGIEIERTTVHPGTTPRQAVELARNLGDDIEAYYDDEHGMIVDGEFVATAIDFRKGDLFLVERQGQQDGYYQVYSDHNWTRGVEVVQMDAEPGTFEMEYHDAGAEWDQIDSYGNLWLAWLQGHVVPIEKKSVYIRSDTGTEVTP